MIKFSKFFALIVLSTIIIGGAIIPDTISLATSNRGISLKSVHKTTAKLKVGQYIRLGKYNDESIIWRCVDIDSKGTLMLADRILSIKPFDAKGAHKYSYGSSRSDDPVGARLLWGSNLWQTSNMRSWLNSTAIAGKVRWLDGCPPKKDNVFHGVNAYENEKGFLAVGNFTAYERRLIKTVTLKSLLNKVDFKKLKYGGSEYHFWNPNISRVIQNFDKAYYHNLTEKVFLLDIKQIKQVYLNKSKLGSKYYIGKPTQKAVDKSEFKADELNASKYWSSWLRTPDADPRDVDPDDSRYVKSDGSVRDHSAYYQDVGIRPAFYINLNKLIIKSGIGSLGNPFVLG